MVTDAVLLALLCSMTGKCTGNISRNKAVVPCTVQVVAVRSCSSIPGSRRKCMARPCHGSRPAGPNHHALHNNATAEGVETHTRIPAPRHHVRAGALAIIDFAQVILAPGVRIQRYANVPAARMVTASRNNSLPGRPFISYTTDRYGLVRLRYAPYSAAAFIPAGV
jgi:hypothetical protein